MARAIAAAARGRRRVAPHRRGVDGGAGALAVPEQLAHGGQPDAVHDALRGVGMPGIMDVDAVQSGFLPDPDPEGVEAGRSEVVGKYPRPVFLPGQRRENLHRFRPESKGARAGLGILEARARAVFRQRPYFVRFEVEHFGEPCAGQGQ